MYTAIKTERETFIVENEKEENKEFALEKATNEIYPVGHNGKDFDYEKTEEAILKAKWKNKNKRPNKFWGRLFLLHQVFKMCKVI